MSSRRCKCSGGRVSRWRVWGWGVYRRICPWRGLFWRRVSRIWRFQEEKTVFYSPCFFYSCIFNFVQLGSINSLLPCCIDILEYLIARLIYQLPCTYRVVYIIVGCAMCTWIFKTKKCKRHLLSKRTGLCEVSRYLLLKVEYYPIWYGTLCIWFVFMVN